MKISIKRVDIKGRKRWRLEYRLNGKRFRPSFKTKEMAESERDRVAQEVMSSGHAWVSLSPSERTELMAVVREVKIAGLTIRKVWDEYSQMSHSAAHATFSEAFGKFIEERELMRVARRTLKALKSNVGRFALPRGSMPIGTVSRDDVVGHLAGYTGRTYNSYLTSLNTFFRWCVSLKMLKENPAASIPKIHSRRMVDADEAPGVLSYDQCVKLLGTALEHDRGLCRYVAVCLLAGLRPEREAAHLSPENISDKIHVRGRTAKTRQERYVAIVPALAGWLALPLGGGRIGPGCADWPIVNLRKRMEAVKKKAGLWKSWPPDCLRHTFASAYHAVYGADETISALGHGDYDMLFGHYRRLMTKADGEKILSITPSLLAP